MVILGKENKKECKRMNNQRYFDIIREIRDVSFATVDKEGKPQIRIIDVMLVENEKLYFVTARGKSFYDELIEKYLRQIP